MTPRATPLDKQWEALMTLCRKESELQSESSHPKLLKLVSQQINQLASEMGFNPKQIQTRHFQAERDGLHIVRIRTD